jgi:hypothetical protein
MPTRQEIGGAAIHWKPPFKDQLMCGVIACVIHTTTEVRKVTCAECLGRMGENYLRNMEAAGLVPPAAP